MCCLVLRSNFALLLTIQFVSLLFIFFIYFFFPAKILSGPYFWNRYSQRLQIECAAWSCGLIVHCCLPSNSLRYFLFFKFFSFFSATILSVPYLWNHYSQRLQIEGAACSCGLILHCCLPSNLLHYFFFFFRHDFVGRRVFHLREIAPRSHTGRPRTCLVIIIISELRRGCYMGLQVFFFFPPRYCQGHISGTVTRRDSKLSVLLGPAVSLCTVAYHPIRFVIFIFFFFFSDKILYGPYLWKRYSQRLQIECAAWSCGLILHSCLPSNSLCYLFIFFFSPRFCHDIVRAISPELLLAEIPN